MHVLSVHTTRVFVRRTYIVNDVGVWSSKYIEERGGDRHPDKSDLL